MAATDNVPWLDAEEMSAWVNLIKLADMIDDTSSCVTHRVNRLVEAGLVDKQPDPIDLRARRVVLTRAGRRLLEHTAPEHVVRVRSWVIDPLDRSDLIEL